MGLPGDERYRLSDGDLRWLVAATARRRSDYERIVALIRGKPDLIDVLLDDPELVDKLYLDRDKLLPISPLLMFSVLIERARRDLRESGFTLEWDPAGALPVFDAPEAAALLDDRAVRTYLAQMLTSFTRTESVTVRLRGRRGWVRRAYSDLSVEDMAELGEMVEGPHRLPFLQRAADVCLLLTGMFPEHLARIRRSVEEYEGLGKEFYRKAAELTEDLDTKRVGVFRRLAEAFTLARKPLALIARRYMKGRDWLPPDFPPLRWETG